MKPGFLDKWYSDIEAQYQTKKRYSAAITASRLSYQDPHMIYAQANNANRYVYKTIGSTMNSNIDGDGKSQYGSYNYQHNWQTKGTQQYTSNRFNISANMGHSDGWNSGKTSTETFFPNQEHTFGVKDTYRYKHNLKPQLEAKLFAYTDSANTIDVKVKASYEKSRKSYEEKSASYGYQPDQFAYHSLKEALDAKPGEHHAQTDAQMDERADREVDYHAGEGTDDNAEVQLELLSRKDRLPLRTARHHSRAHKQHVRAVYLPEVEDNKDINPEATLYSYNSATGVYTSKPMNVKGGDMWKFAFNYDQGIGFYFRLMNKFAL